MTTLIADWSMYQSVFTGDAAIFADKYNPNKWVVNIDFNAVAGSGVVAVIIRVGISQMKDPCFDRYLAGLQQIKMPWGIYHAYDPGRAPAAQADLVRSWCPTDPPLGVFGDIEMGSANFASANSYLQALDARFKRTTGIYSANWYMAQYFSLSEQTNWHGRTAWFAGYPGLVVPAGWVSQPRQFDLHQFSETATMAGVPRLTDMNELHPALKLSDLLGGAGAAPGNGVNNPPGTTSTTTSTRFGLHGRADGRLQPADLQVVQNARIEAVKLMSTADPADVDHLRAINHSMLIIVRCFADFRNQTFTAQRFAQVMAGDLAPFYAKGVRHFEVHNEPNLLDEGLAPAGGAGSWTDGASFAAWFSATVALLSQTFPDAVWGWPGLSPGGDRPGIGADADQFLQQAGGVPATADWIGIHAYWTNAAGLPAATDSVAQYAARFPGQTLYVTEFANPDPAVDKAAKANQYRDFLTGLQRWPVAAAFAFLSSASDAKFAGQAWRDEAGQLSVIPGIVGARSMPTTPWWEKWPSGVIKPSRRLVSPPAAIEIVDVNGQPLAPPIHRQNAMDVFERKGALLRVTDQPINGRLWWVHATDVEPV